MKVWLVPLPSFSSLSPPLSFLPSLPFSSPSFFLLQISFTKKPLFSSVEKTFKDVGLGAYFTVTCSRDWV